MNSKTKGEYSKFVWRFFSPPFIGKRRKKMVECVNKKTKRR
jgi:hypothetical protein